MVYRGDADYGGDSFVLQQGTRALGANAGNKTGTITYPVAFPVKPVISFQILSGSSSIGRASGLRAKYTGASSVTFNWTGSAGTIAWSGIGKYPNWPSNA